VSALAGWTRLGPATVKQARSFGAVAWLAPLPSMRSGVYDSREHDTFIVARIARTWDELRVAASATTTPRRVDLTYDVCVVGGQWFTASLLREAEELHGRLWWALGAPQDHGMYGQRSSAVGYAGWGRTVAIVAPRRSGAS
jgi:hypothetical protein